MSDEDMDNAISAALPWWPWLDDAPMPSTDWMDAGPLLDAFAESISKVGERVQVTLDRASVNAALNKARVLRGLPSVIGNVFPVTATAETIPRALARALVIGLRLAQPVGGGQ